MKIVFRRLKTLVLISALTIGACQSTSAKNYAALETADSQTMAIVKSVLAHAMKRKHIEIGPGDLTKTSTISVLPPRLVSNEDRSTVTPTLFDIKMIGSTCFVVRRDTLEEYVLSGVACRPLGD